MTYQEAGRKLAEDGYKFEAQGFIDIKGIRHLVEYWGRGEDSQIIMVHNTQIATLFEEIING